MPPASARFSVVRLVVLAFAAVGLLVVATELVFLRLAARADHERAQAQQQALFLERLLDLRSALEERGASARARLFEPSPAADALDRERRARVLGLLDTVEQLLVTDQGRQLHAAVRTREADYTAAVERVLTGPAPAARVAEFQRWVPPLRTALSQAIDALLAFKVRHVHALITRSADGAARARTLSLVAVALALLLGVLVVGRLTREVDRRLRREERALQLRDEFLSAASHELRTPLTTLGLQLDALRRALPPAPATDRSLERMRVQLRRLVLLIEGLLDVSRLEAGRLTLRRERVDLALLVREAAAELDAQFVSAGARLTLAADEPVEGAWDPLRLHLVVTNLLSNALKYGEGSPVEVAVRRQGGEALVRVANGGPGIAPGDQARVFERFERASDKGGTGVGLWLVRELVRAHGGRVALESAPGGTTAFTVALPLEPRAGA